MKVVIGGPIRNREWILQRHLDALKAMVIPEGVEIEFFYLLNDSTDKTLEILQQNGIFYLINNTEHHSGWVRGKYSYENLAYLRNCFVQTALEEFHDATHILSIDSDILVPSDALQKLLEDDKDIVSMLLCNQPMPIHVRRAHNVMYEDSNGIMQHIYDFPMDEVFPCDLTGACYLIKREVIDAGCEYADDRQGEDIPFCRNAKSMGFGIFCDSRIRPVHVMYEGQEIVAGRIIPQEGGVAHEVSIGKAAQEGRHL